MAVRFTDEEIETLIKEPKPYHRDWFQPSRMSVRFRHRRIDIDTTGANGNQFVVKLRKSEINPLDFSVILGVIVPGTNMVFRLRRYNGKSHQHKNKLTGDTIYDFHIHTATLRYQQNGFKEDTYAEQTDRYSTLAGAINCMIDDCAFHDIGPSLPSLFTSP